MLGHLAAAAVCAYLAQHTLWALALLPLIAGSLMFGLRQSNPVERIIWRAPGDWYWQYADGSHGQGVCAGSSLRLPWLVILQLRDAENSHLEQVVLARDSLAGEQHRRLRGVLLRLAH